MQAYRSPLLEREHAVEADGLDAGVAAHYGHPHREQRLLAANAVGHDLGEAMLEDTLRELCEGHRSFGQIRALDFDACASASLRQQLDAQDVEHRAQQREQQVADLARARDLVAAFEARFDPAREGTVEERREASEEHLTELGGLLDDVASLDHDRIIRGLVSVLRGTLRTNFYVADLDGEPKPYVSLKLSPRDIDLLPPVLQPRLLAAIDEPARMLMRLFAIRSRALLHGADAAHASASLSGTIIGQDIAGALARFGKPERLTLVGGGTLALIETGDRIRLDLEGGRLDLLLPEEEIARRRAALDAEGGYQYPANQTPWQEIQRGIVGQMESGAVLEPAVRYQRIAQTQGLPRDNH